MMGTPWRLLIEDTSANPALSLALDEAVAKHVGEAKAAATIRLWRNTEVLVVGRFGHRLPRFEAGVRLMKARGIEVLQRISGGGAVLHDLSVVNFSITVPRLAAEPPGGVHDVYETFCKGVVNGLRRLGIRCTFGNVAGAFCDGSHNLVVDGKKIAGTAQARRKGFVLVHGTLLVNSDTEGMTRTIRSFYQAAGARCVAKAEALTTLTRQLNKPLSFEEVCTAVTQGYRALGEVSGGTLLASELRLAQRLKEAGLFTERQAGMLAVST